MVQVAENRSYVECRPVGVAEPGPNEGWHTTLVRVERVEPMAGWSDLLGEAAGREYTAIVPERAWEQLEDRAVWRVEASLVGPHRIAVRSAVSAEERSADVEVEAQRSIEEPPEPVAGAGDDAWDETGDGLRGDSGQGG